MIMYNIMEQLPNKCNAFLNPVSNKYNNVVTVDDLNIGIMTASKKVFELGVKYTKEMFITITTAEATILVEASLKTVEHFMDKLKENPKMNEILTTQMPKIIGLLDSGVNILRYIGYDYLTKSYYNYASANKSYTYNDNELTQDGIGFKKLLDLVSQTNNVRNQPEEYNRNGLNSVNRSSVDGKNDKIKGGVNVDKQLDEALTIVDKLTDDIMKLPPELRENELFKITDMLKQKINKQSGGKLKLKLKSKTKRCRVIRKMIKRTMRKFCNVYPRINK
jgi:hypothetical protein